jgi:hypothetical protein
MPSNFDTRQIATATIQSKINKLDELLDKITSSLTDIVQVKRQSWGEKNNESTPTNSNESPTIERMDQLLYYMEQEQLMFEFTGASAGLFPRIVPGSFVQNTASQYNSSSGSITSPNSRSPTYQYSSGFQSIFPWKKQERSWNLVTRTTGAKNKVQVQAVVAKVFIQFLQAFKTFQFATSLTVGMANINLLKLVSMSSTANGSDQGQFKLFEVIGDLNLERPLFDHEVLLDVIHSWNPSSCKSHLAFKSEYIPQVPPFSIGAIPLCGWAFIEVKRKKWQYKFVELRPNGDMYYHDEDYEVHSKNPESPTLSKRKQARASSSTDISNLSSRKEPVFVCHILHSNFYSITKPLKKAPTKYCFAIKSNSHLKLFQDEVDYFKVIAVEDAEKLSTWLAYLYAAKKYFYQEQHSTIISTASLVSEDFRPRTMSCSLITQQPKEAIKPRSNTIIGTICSSPMSEDLSRSHSNLHPAVDGRTMSLRASMIQESDSPQLDPKLSKSNLKQPTSPTNKSESPMSQQANSSQESIKNSNRSSFHQGLTLNMNEHFCDQSAPSRNE